MVPVGSYNVLKNSDRKVEKISLRYTKTKDELNRQIGDITSQLSWAKKNLGLFF